MDLATTPTRRARPRPRRRPRRVRAPRLRRPDRRAALRRRRARGGAAEAGAGRLVPPARAARAAGPPGAAPVRPARPAGTRTRTDALGRGDVRAGRATRRAGTRGRRSRSPAAAVDALLGAIAGRDLGRADAAAIWLGGHASTDDVMLLADPLLDSLAAAGHGAHLLLPPRRTAAAEPRRARAAPAPGTRDRATARAADRVDREPRRSA